MTKSPDARPPLAAGVADWLDQLAQVQRELGPADPADLTALRLREQEQSDRLAARVTDPVDPRAAVEDVEVPVGAGLFARRFRPAGADVPLPTQLYLHGGGFCAGSARELGLSGALATRAVQARVQILALDYRLAPEHPYPAAVDDAVAALDLLAEEPHRWGCDPVRLGVGGMSAGGHIAAVTALRLRERHQRQQRGPRLVHQLLEVPVVDFHTDWPSVVAFAPEDELARYVRLFATYRGGTTADEIVEPFRVPDLADLPPALVMTAELDPLRDSAEAYAGRLARAGVPTQLRRGDGQLHATSMATATVPGARDWQRAAVDGMRAAYWPASR